MLQIESESAVRTLEDLCIINATSGLEKPVAGYLTDYLQKLGFNPFIDNSAELTGSNTGNLVCKIGSGGDFLLLAHMDTARPTDKLKILRKDGKVCSDGSSILGSDDRAGIAAVLNALKYAVDNNLPLKDFTIAFTVCEETTLGGSQHLEINADIKKGFIFDSSYRPGKFIFSSPGAKYLEIEITGRASHSGISPEKGINAIAVAANAISRLNQGRLDDRTTMNIGTIEGGTATNVIPEKVKMKGEIRSFDSARVEEVCQNMKSVFKDECDKHGAMLEFSDKWDFKPYTHENDSQVCIEISAAIKECGLEPEPILSFGGSDANSLNARGIPSVNIGIGAQNPHADNEFILIEDLIKASEIALSLIVRK